MPSQKCEKKKTAQEQGQVLPRAATHRWTSPNTVVNILHTSAITLRSKQSGTLHKKGNNCQQMQTTLESTTFVPLSSLYHYDDDSQCHHQKRTVIMMLMVGWKHSWWEDSIKQSPLGLIQKNIKPLGNIAVIKNKNQPDSALSTTNQKILAISLWSIKFQWNLFKKI